MKLFRHIGVVALGAFILVIAGIFVLGRGGMFAATYIAAALGATWLVRALCRIGPGWSRRRIVVIAAITVPCALFILAVAFDLVAVVQHYLYHPGEPFITFAGTIAVPVCLQAFAVGAIAAFVAERTFGRPDGLSGGTPR